MRIIKTITLSLTYLMALSANAMIPGIYAGASLGLQDLLADYQITDIDEDMDVSKNRFKLANDGLVGNVFVGYEQPLFSSTFVAFQADYQFTNTKAHIQNIDIDGETGDESLSSQFSKIKNSFGVSARPGVYINDNSQGYAIIGYRRARFESGFNTTDMDEGAINFHNKFDENGFEYGIGGQIQVNQSIAVRLELTQTQYNNKPFTLPDSNTTFGHKFKVNQGLLSIVYHPVLTK